MSPIASRPVVLAVAAGIAVSFAGGAAAASSGGDHDSVTLREPASSGLAVKAPLQDLAATSAARVIVPLAWARRGTSPAGRLRLIAAPHPSCRFEVTYTVRSVPGSRGSAEDRVATALPAAGSRYVLDSGRRGNSAFRVVRRPTRDARVRVDALWAGVLTRRADIVPAGRQAWTEIRVTAAAQAGNECHSGSYRENLGPKLGDSLAAAHTTLRFRRRG